MVKTKKKLISHQDLSIICAESYQSVDFEEAYNECIKAVAASHGIKATFSTGSQNQ